ncbi:hypothetical protein BD626DRAFT_196702 [Schizophyllum amplum]|uniref:5-hydroxyisourate hydrolase n=1 Tax=Schizophyllum amplum TaxID=97359 RepID=A0A550CMS0_9AGAR|nr:hypothetical protein BD626DRAFT_196702 [Auriculariopsis ampla]
MAKSPITCHVLDASLGKPAEGVEIQLQEFKPVQTAETSFKFDPLARGKTNTDGRCNDLLPPRGSEEAKAHNAELAPGTYKMIFRTKEYFDQTQRESFYPWVEISFTIEDATQHYHIPLLISPYSYTTYRGS